MHKFLPIFILLTILAALSVGVYLYEAPSEEYKVTWPDKEESPLLITEEVRPPNEPSEPEDTEGNTPEEPLQEAEIIKEEGLGVLMDEILEEELSVPDIVVEELVVEIEEIEILEVEPEIEEPSLSFSEINLKTRESLVNIFCTTRGYNSNISPVSGTGTIINEKGVILTNAHIAQYFLLKDYTTEDFVNCVIRTGSPAKAAYKAKLLYISPPWVSENSDTLVTENPLGTGENDFALLIITESVTSLPLPESFPAIGIETTSVQKGDELLVGAYPAGFLGSQIISNSLYASTAITKALELYTFETGTLDVISLGGTVVSQQGSSGGAAINRKGKIVGLISTSSDGESTGDRDLRAISVEHINRSLLESENTSLGEMLSGDLNQKAAEFNDSTAPTLLQIIVDTFFTP